MNMIVFSNILVNVSTLFHSHPDFLKKKFSSCLKFSSHESNWDKKKAEQFCKTLIIEWFTVMQKNIYFALGNLARIVYWSILSIKNCSSAKLISFYLFQFLSWKENLRERDNFFSENPGLILFTHFHFRTGWRKKMIMIGMAIRVVEFSNGGYKIRKIFPKNQHTQRKLLNFEFCKTQNSIIGLMESCQKVPKFDF